MRALRLARAFWTGQDPAALETTSSKDHATARRIVRAAFADLFPDEEPTLAELQLAQAVGHAEGGYGHGWRSPNTHNWGAILRTVSQDGTCPPGSFPNRDATPTSQYIGCFRIYPNDFEGARDVVRQLYVRRPSVRVAALAGDLHAASAGQYYPDPETGVGGYFTGTSKDDETNIQARDAFIGRSIEAIAAALDEPIAISDPPPVGSVAARRGNRKALGFGLVILGLAGATAILGAK